MTKVIHMVSGPRNISTAMMYAFDNRSDCRGIDEPLYGHYLSENPHIDHPGRQQIIEKMPVDLEDCIANIERMEYGYPILLIKNMAHHMIGIDLDPFLKHTFFLLIRDPQYVLASFAKVIDNPVASDIGIKEEWDLYNQLVDSGKEPIVVDTDQFLADPEQAMIILCQKLEIPFEESMLSWSPGARDIDGVWAQYWYHNVHASSGFGAPKKKSIQLNQSLQNIYEEVKPYYLKLRELALH